MFHTNQMILDHHTRGLISQQHSVNSETYMSNKSKLDRTKKYCMEHYYCCVRVIFSISRATTLYLMQYCVCVWFFLNHSVVDKRAEKNYVCPIVNSIMDSLIMLLFIIYVWIVCSTGGHVCSICSIQSQCHSYPPNKKKTHTRQECTQKTTTTNDELQISKLFLMCNWRMFAQISREAAAK